MNPPRELRSLEVPTAHDVSYCQAYDVDNITPREARLSYHNAEYALKDIPNIEPALASLSFASSAA